jgi:hypothetical protein
MFYYPDFFKTLVLVYALLPFKAKNNSFFKFEIALEVFAFEQKDCGISFIFYIQF